MSLTQEQEDALLQLHAITNSQDVDHDRVILESVGWDVQRAIQAIYDKDDVPPEPQASSSNQSAPTPPTRSFEPMEVDDSRVVDARPLPKGSIPFMYPLFTRIVAVLSYPLTFSLSIVANIVQFVFRLLRIPVPRFNPLGLRLNLFGGNAGRPTRRPRPGNPVDAAERWIRELEDDTGAMSVSRATVAAIEGEQAPALDSEGLRRREKVEGRGRLLPDFWIGSYEAALKAAQSEARVLSVIIVSEEHDDTLEFKRNVLTDPDFVRVLTDNEFIVWGGDVRDSEAYQTALKLGATAYPFVAFVSLHPRPSRGSSHSSPTLSVISRHEGSPSTHTSATTLCNHITNTLLPRVTPVLNRVKTEARVRQQERQLREEQDRAFREAARIDREKMERRQTEERKKREEEAERTRQLEAKRLEEERQAEAKRLEASKRDEWRRWNYAHLPAEPPASASDSLRIGIRMPTGTRLVRRFNPTSTMENLYTYVDSQFLSPDALEGAASAPPPSHKPTFDFLLVSAFPRQQLPQSSTALGELPVLRGGANLVVESMAATNGHDAEDSDEDSD